MNAWVALVHRKDGTIVTDSSATLAGLLRLLANDAERADPKWVRIEIAYR